MNAAEIEAGRYGAGSPFDWPVAIGYSRAPLASYPAGGFAAVAGSNGVAIGIFGWIDPDGIVSNTQEDDEQLLVFVLPLINSYNWQRVYPSFPAFTGRNISGYPVDPYQNPAPFTLAVIRAGYETVLASVGTFKTRFPGGGQVGDQVWADPDTGLAYDANVTGGYVPTPWTCMQNGNANAALVISSFVTPLA
jgi:hypothetical protein